MGEENLFNRDTLKKALLSGTIMVAIDQDFNKNEWIACKDFLRQHWQDEYGNAQDFFKEVLEELKYILLSGERIQEEIDHFAGDLAEVFNDDQVDSVLNLIKTIMKADGMIDPKESALFRKFAKKLRKTAQ